MCRIFVCRGSKVCCVGCSMQCRTCGDHGNLSLLDPEHASLLPQLAAGCSVCHDCDVEIKHWSNFLHTFQTSQTRFQQVLHTQQTDVPLKVARVLVPKLLECDFCCFYTDNKTQLATHMQAHLHTPNTAGAAGSTRRYPLKEGKVVYNQKCDQCSKLFSHAEMLAWHQENCHGTEAIVKIVKISDTEHGYQCVFCETVCKNSMDAIIRHLHLHHQISNFPFPCNVCGKRFIEYRVRNKHQLNCKNKKSVKSNDSPLNSGIKCRLCNGCFESESLLKEHISNFHAKKSEPNQCLYCVESFTSFPRLKSHCENKHPGKPILQCDECQAGFTTNTGYSLHKKCKHKNHIFTCDVCKKTFKSYSPYWKHRKYKHANLVFTCNICSSTYPSPLYLSKHIRNMHSVLQQPLPCTFCSAEFRCKEYLNQHIRESHTRPFIYCQHCKFKTRKKYSLVLHMKRVHLTLPTKKRWSCKLCSTKFKHKQYLLNHIYLIHTGPILHCANCHYTTRRKSNLRSHLINNHYLNLRKSLPCTLCGTKFKYKMFLKKHIRLEHTDLDLRCAHCHYTTRRRSNLRIHIITQHFQLKKSLSCMFCSATYKHKAYLQTHIRQVHTGPILQCARCKYNTRNRGVLVQHIKRWHSDSNL